MHSLRRSRRADRRPPARRFGARDAAARQPLPFRLLARVLIGVLVPLLGVTWLAAAPGSSTGNAQATEVAGAAPRPEPRASRSLARSGMTGVTAAVLVTVVADGRSRTVITEATTVAGVLDQVKINRDRNDRVAPAPSTAVQRGQRIVVKRVQARLERRELAVPYETQERPTDELVRGKTRQVQAGRDGIVRIVERVVVVDGTEASRREVRRLTITAPVPEIVDVGTAAPPHRRKEPAPPPPQAPPAQAEQAAPSGEPAAGTERTQSGEASYYYYPEEGLTAAHRTLPLGTVVTVVNRANGKSVQVTINDRGPYIDGRIIDLNEPAFSKIASTSSGVISVRISW